MSLILVNDEFSVYIDETTNEVFQEEPSGKLRRVKFRKNKQGRVYFDTWIFVKSTVGSGYIYDTSIRKRFFYARVLAELFIPNPDGYRFVEHLDGDLENFTISNLCWSKVQQSYLRKIKINGEEVY